jgi:hypothetical protein
MVSILFELILVSTGTVRERSKIKAIPRTGTSDYGTVQLNRYRTRTVRLQCCGSGSASVFRSVKFKCFWALPDPHLDPLVRAMDPDPSIIKQN